MIRYEVERAKEHLKWLAVSHTSMIPSQVISAVIEKCSETVVTGLPEISSMRRIINLWRAPVGIKTAKCREDIVLTDKQKLDLRGGEFKVHSLKQAFATLSCYIF